MKTNFETSYHNNESRHFWFKARRDFIKRLLSKSDKRSVILDIGCASGILIKELIEDGFDANLIHGIDISQTAIERSKTLGLTQTQVMDAQQIKFGHKFDILIASDCLEHIKEDNKALNHWSSLLKPNGILLVFVPAYRFLWSKHDEANMHYRRYTKSELKQKLKASNFIIDKASYWNTLLFLPIAMVRILSRIFYSKSSVDSVNLNIPIGNTMFYKLLRLENKYLLKYNSPFGVSVFCVAKKP